ncbi:ribosomal protein S18 [Daldinia caldariorum]|uniref:ribosomal protein S18 n=1 Tax=Daldinia caldariorum TaxID=326644 RepID=UPI00200837F9|nr:ribosomal protein S18 [Daldinia caldariorum]KAI1468138.1 ribosomal protein S18 [Daldinia caldariorum]
MPPRIPLAAALRQPSTLFRSQVANISTTNPQQIIRQNVPSIASNLLDLDSSSSSSPQQQQQQQQHGPQDSTAVVSTLYDRLRHTVARRVALEEKLRENGRAEDFLRQLPRRWRAGDVYAPHDMSPSEMNKLRRTQARKRDLVDVLGLSPLDMYRNFSVISEFMTAHGRIKRAVDTGLRPVNQRKMAKAVRRAIGLGLHPSVHFHPEILIRENVRYQAQTSATVNRNVRS